VLDPPRSLDQGRSADLLAVLTELKIGSATFFGTSYGGLLAMMLAVSRPAAIAGAVLNNIGPVIEREGLLRLKLRIEGSWGTPPDPAEFRGECGTLALVAPRRLPATLAPSMRLLQDQGRGEEALTLLQSIYDQFTEGFDTTELIHANAPLSNRVAKLA